MQPLVSVIIPAFNSARTIARAIDSVAAQRYERWEIVVVNDGSTDATREVAQGYPQVRLLDLEGNQGPSAARNAGIRAAKGEFIAFLDADDEWLPEKLERQVEVLLQQPRTGIIACEGFTIEDGCEPQPLYPADVPRVTGPEAWRALMARAYIFTSATVLRRSVLDRAGLFNTDLAIGEDQDLWIRVACVSDVAFLPDRLVIKHQQPNGTCNRNSHLVARQTLAMVRSCIEASRDRLTRREIRRIWGWRFAALGRSACYDGKWREGLPLIARAMMRGHQPLGNALFVTRRLLVAFWRRSQLTTTSARISRKVSDLAAR